VPLRNSWQNTGDGSSDSISEVQENSTVYDRTERQKKEGIAGYLAVLCLFLFAMELVREFLEPRVCSN
jgi:hypothetical protein